MRSVPDTAPLGWIGWLGYELRGLTMGVPVRHVSRYPDAGLLWVDRGILFDHARGTTTFIALADVWTPPLKRWLARSLKALRSAAPVAAYEPAPAEVSWRYSDADYLQHIRDCQAAITEGEAYQLCLTTEATLDVRPDPLAAYLALRRSSATHHGALLRVAEVALLSASPETFLHIDPSGLIESKPIKGTRPRGANSSADAALRVQLLGSEKERAENLMIVDLMRNDIGRVSEVGSVSVPSLLAVESYPHVHQLVSTVRGQLAAGLSPIDAVVACFPAGSMTGAPKQRATEILDGLENRARGIYSGAFGYFSPDGTVDLAMVIRSIVLDPVGATVGSGGGITALSVPEEELDEVRLKAAALLAVLTT
jgi:anthranilate synthase component 1